MELCVGRTYGCHLEFFLTEHQVALAVPTHPPLQAAIGVLDLELGRRVVAGSQEAHRVNPPRRIDQPTSAILGYVPAHIPFVVFVSVSIPLTVAAVRPCPTELLEIGDILQPVQSSRVECQLLPG